MSELKSMTQRTVVRADVSERGSVEITVVRNGSTVHAFSLDDEQGLNIRTEFERDGDELIVREEGPRGSMVESERITLKD